MSSDLQSPAADKNTVGEGVPPGLTVCSLCVGETLGDTDSYDGGQLARLRKLEADGTARVTLAECLDECNRGDVIVARPLRARRGRTPRPVWLERVAGDELTKLVADWLAAGGPGRARLSMGLEPHVISKRTAPATSESDRHGIVPTSA